MTIQNTMEAITPRQSIAKSIHPEGHKALPICRANDNSNRNKPTRLSTDCFVRLLKASILMKENGVFNVKNKHLSSFC